MQAGREKGVTYCNVTADSANDVCVKNAFFKARFRPKKAMKNKILLKTEIYIPRSSLGFRHQNHDSLILGFIAEKIGHCSVTFSNETYIYIFFMEDAIFADSFDMHFTKSYNVNIRNGHVSSCDAILKAVTHTKMSQRS